MARDRDEFVRDIERLPLSAENKAFLLKVRDKFESEKAAHGDDEPTAQVTDQ